MREGKIIEHGSFNQLMKNKGHLAKLIGEHVQIIDPASSPALQKPSHFTLRNEKTSQTHHKNIRRRSDPETKNLTHEQKINRRRFSLTNNIPDNDKYLARQIEENQLSLMGTGTHRRFSADIALQRNLASMITDVTEIPEEDENEVIPEDAEPMKLVLEDQSVNYKKSPYASYIKAGLCSTKCNAIMFLSLVSFFFLSYGTSLGRGIGKKIHELK
jgi:hypothetical protein